MNFPNLVSFYISENKINRDGKILIDKKIKLNRGKIIFSHGIKIPKKILVMDFGHPKSLLVLFKI